MTTESDDEEKVIQPHRCLQCQVGLLANVPAKQLCTLDKEGFARNLSVSFVQEQPSRPLTLRGVLQR